MDTENIFSRAGSARSNAENISSNDISTIKLLLEKEAEVCGSLKIIPCVNLQDNLRLYIESFGEPSICNHKNYSKYMWHTHPYTSKKYPGSHDLLKVLKKTSGGIFPYSCLVFSSWGIWEYAGLKEILDIDSSNNVMTFINNTFKPLYFLSEKGRGLLNRVILDSINKSIETLMFNLHIKISFTPWNLVENIYYLKYPEGYI